jgi:hypothetical protein
VNTDDLIAKLTKKVVQDDLPLIFQLFIINK